MTESEAKRSMAAAANASPTKEYPSTGPTVLAEIARAAAADSLSHKVLRRDCGSGLEDVPVFFFGC